MTVTDAEAASRKEEISHGHLYRVTGLSSSNLEKSAQVPESDFEEAIAATGYGSFNVVLLLCSVPAFWSAVSTTSAASYIFTRAKCDMNLEFHDMGTINAMTYIGMISSAVLWGYLSDTLGRRSILVWGFISSGVAEIVAAVSQNFTMLLVMKFASGFLFNGPFAVLISYLAELHRADLRARVILLSSFFFTLANITLPLLAWAIITRDWKITFFEGEMVLSSWNLFLLATALVPIVTGLMTFRLPESPKFLMSRGRNDEAMEILKGIYSMNTGKPAETYPISRLVQEKYPQRGRGLRALQGGVSQLLPLFRPPHVGWLIIISFAHACCMFGSNSIRLWYPQLAAMISSEGNASLCSAIAPQPQEDAGCTPLETDMFVYLQTVVVGTGSLLTYGIGGMLINRCGKKMVSGVCGVASAVFIGLLPILGSGSFPVVAMVTTALALTALCSASLSSIAVDLFPTPLRVMAMAVFFMSGRLGTISGTIIFSRLMSFGCLPPFLTTAATLTACGISCFFLPNTTLKRLD